MGATFWVYARGQWRQLELPAGRVCGWGGRARFCFVRRGRLQLARASAVLRGLRALQAGQPTTVRDGLQLSQRRSHVMARVVSPRCCCRAVAAETRNALVQLNLTTTAALQQPNNAALRAQPTKTDAAVQADSLTQSGDGEQSRKRTRSPAPLPPAKVAKADHSDSNESSVPPCKELIVNEEDVLSLRRFLEKDESGLFSVDLRRFDADDQYKSALFYKINPLVCAERDARIADMVRQQRDEQSLLRAFAGSLGLRAVGELRARARYRMRPRRSSDKENALTPAADAVPDRSADKSPNNSANKSRDKFDRSTLKSLYRVMSSDTDSSDSDSDFQEHSLVRSKKLKYDKNTRLKFAGIRSKHEMSKTERDNDVRSKYLVRPRKMQGKEVELVNSESSDDESLKHDRSNRSRSERGRNDKNKDRNDLPKGKERDDLSKGKERKDYSKHREINFQIQAEIYHKPRERQRNVTASKDEDASRERSQSTDMNRRRSLRARDESHSPSIIAKKLKTVQRNESSKDISESTDSTVQERKARSRDRRGRYKGNARNTTRSEKRKSDRLKDSSKSGDNSINRKRNYRDLSNSVDRSKDRKINGESSDENVSLSKTVAKGQRKEKDSNSNSPSKPNNKTKGINRNLPTANTAEDSDESENVWASRNGTKDVVEDGSQSKEDATQKDGSSHDQRPRRSTANTQSVFTVQRREYSSLEDHAIVQWVSMGNRASRVNGNTIWRELQDQFERIAGRARSWHSLRNRYLRGILPALGALALPPARVSALRAAHARGEIKSRRRPPVANPLLSQPAVRSAWGARPRPAPSDDTQDTLVPATSESESQRTLRSSTARAGSPRKHSPRKHSPRKHSPRKHSPRKHTPRAQPPQSSKQHSSKKIPSSKDRQASPTYSEVTRKFGSAHAASTPELRPRDTETKPAASPHKRRLFNPRSAM